MPREIPNHATYRRLHVCCGRERCKQCRGVNYTHGPYWYAEWLHERKRKRGTPRVVTRTAYVGKYLPTRIAREIAKGIGEDAEAAREQLHFARLHGDDQGDDD